MAFWNRKNTIKKSNERITTSFDGNNFEIDATMFRDITQSVALFMCSAKIIDQPALRYFNSDQGICEGLYVQHTTNPQILQLKKMSPDTYLSVVGMHAFGAGIYVTNQEVQLNKPIDHFSSDDIYSIAKAFEQTDAYELALKILHIPLDSKNKLILDQIILTALETAKKVAGSEIMEPKYMRAYMQVLFNAGSTMVLKAL